MTLHFSRYGGDFLPWPVLAGIRLKSKVLHLAVMAGINMSDDFIFYFFKIPRVIEIIVKLCPGLFWRGLA